MSHFGHEPTEADLRGLIQSLCDGTLSPPEMAQLDRWLISSERARHLFREHLELHAALLAPFGAVRGEPPPAPRRRRRVGVVALALACVLVVAAGWWLAGPRVPAPGLPGGADVIGYLSCEEGCQWGEGGGGPGPVAAGKALDLRQGLAEVHYRDGTHLTLEGPVQARLVSARVVELDHGRARAEVPPAQAGFTIKTPAARVIDRGTEFEVVATREGRTEVAVYRGQVECLALDTQGEVRERASVPGGQKATIQDGKAEMAAVESADERAQRRYGPAPGLWAYWRFEDEVGPPPSLMQTQRAVLADASGQGRRLDFWPGGPDGVGRYRFSDDVPPAAMFRPGLSGGRRSFDCGALPAEAPGVLSYPSGAGEQAVLGGGFTVEGFFKSRGDQSRAGSLALLYQGEKYHSYLLGLNHFGPGMLGAQIVGAASGQLARVSCTLGKDNFADGRWHYCALRYRPATASGPGQLRLDSLSEQGRSVSTTTPVPVGFRLACSKRPLLFGRTRYYRHEAPKQHFPGLLDEVRLSSTVLRNEQLLARGPFGAE